MNPLKHYRIFDEEPCPCGSGMKYSLCCKKREDSFQRDNKRPVEVQAAETLKKSQYKCCLHPDKSRCVKHIKEAHALQNNKIISLLSENGHVYMLNDKKPPLIIPTKDELENQIYEKMSQENEVFLAEMKAKSPDEIISHAYEIACRDNLLILFEDETSLSERQLTVLNEFEHPLSQLYTDWLSRDTDEMDAFRDSIACCADDILRKRVEEKYRDPAQPIYPNTRSESIVRGEVFEWMASRDRTLTCAGAFEKDATNAYNDGKLPAFLKEWTNTYGKGRCMFVLACTMAQRGGDERFYLPARQTAGRFAALQKQMGGHTDIYAVDNHSCVINAAMEELAKPERSKEKPVAQRKQSEPER